MMKSMTGYGKQEFTLANQKYTVEIRSLNGKNADISIKTSLIPREKEMEVRQYLSKVLNRGNIDLFINADKTTEENAKVINRKIAADYLRQIREMEAELGISPADGAELTSMLVKMPDTIETAKNEIDEEGWDIMFQAIRSAASALDAFREKEGAILAADLKKRVELIMGYIAEVEKFEKTRTETIKQRILSRMEELKLNPDMNRMEQELIYYIEKLDITEEKVRLAQHCRYFIETMENEELPGKKLGFIAQEMGREINTTGSKSNQAEMQKIVVMMKDELEKIKEQSLNIL